MNFLTGFDKQSLFVKLAGCLALIGVLGAVDYLTGYELSFSLFYVLPIALATWTIGRSAGLAAALLSAAIWLWADQASGHPYSHPLIPIWNTLIRLSFFIIITLLISSLSKAMLAEQGLARVDNLTGAVNSRYFYELADREVDRLKRFDHPFTLVYFDLDNFKTVNDQGGHSTGDEVLRTVVGHGRQSLRKTDIIARLGGDEFALLLPETGPDAAQRALPGLQKALLEEMERKGWPITFSIGVLTCTVAPGSIDELVKLADDLMYEIKRTGKNAIKFATFAG